MLKVAFDIPGFSSASFSSPAPITFRTDDETERKLNRLSDRLGVSRSAMLNSLAQRLVGTAASTQGTHDAVVEALHDAIRMRKAYGDTAVGRALVSRNLSLALAEMWRSADVGEAAEERRSA